VFNVDDWRVIGEYVYDDQGGRHQAFYSAKRDLNFKDICIKARERIQVEQSVKYSSKDAEVLFRAADLQEVKKWSASSETYSE